MIAIPLAVVAFVAIVFGVAYGTNRPAAATPAVAQSTICALTVCVDVPTVTLPGVTVTRLVTLPPRTVRVPPVTVTEIVRVPPVTQTIIQPPRTLPGPVRTVVRPGLPGPTKTATVVVSREVVSNGTAPPVTREVRSTVSGPNGQTTTSSATVTPSKEVVRVPGTTRTVTKFQAIGLSLLALLALMGLGLFLLWLGFVLGYKSSERNNNNFLRALRDSIKRKPGKHM